MMDYKLSSVVNKIKFAREAAAVERVHASPGTGSYSNGMHTFNMLTMLLILKSDVSGSLIRAVIEHDLPERITGDMPHPAKKAGIQNKDNQTIFEIHLNELVFGEDDVQRLDEDELKWLHGLDMIEFYCWCKDQIMKGNIAKRTKLLAVEDYMVKYSHLYPQEIMDIYYEIKSHDWYDLPDAGGL